MSDLNVHHVAVKFMLKIMTLAQKVYCIELCPHFCQEVVTSQHSCWGSPLGMNWIQTRDKTTVFTLKESRISKTEKANASQECDDKYACHLLWICGVVHLEFVPKGQNVNTQVCCNDLRRLAEAIDWTCKRLKYCVKAIDAPTWQFADSQNIGTLQFLGCKNMITIAHLSCWPDLYLLRLLPLPEDETQA